MYRPPAFREDRPDALRALIRSHPLGTLVTAGTSGLNANLLPFSLVEGTPDLLRAHLARANDHVADLRDADEALVIFQGPQAYVSPGWYPAKQEHGRVVPTWNYVTVHVWGRPRLFEDEAWLREQLAALTAEHEADQRAPWAIEDAPTPYIAGQLKGIVGLEIPIDRIEGKWKVSQNQSAANRAGVVRGLLEREPGCLMATLVDRAAE